MATAVDVVDAGIAYALLINLFIFSPSTIPTEDEYILDIVNWISKHFDGTLGR